MIYWLSDWLPLQNSEWTFPLRVSNAPSDGSINTRGGKFCNFRSKSTFIPETVRDRPISLIGSHRQPIYPCWFRWPCVTMKGGTRWVIFPAVLVITLVPFHLERTNSWDGFLSRAWAIASGRGPSVPYFGGLNFWDPYVHPYGLT